MSLQLRSLLVCLMVHVAAGDPLGGTTYCGAWDCPLNWLPYDDSCYRVIGSLNTWFEARDSCRSLGGELASVHSPGENEFLYNLWKDSVGECFNYGAWLGMNDLSIEGDFVYTDGTTKPLYGYDNWLPGEPSNTRGHEHCGHFWYQNSDSDSIRGWNDVDCNQRNPYICKRDLC